MPKYTPNQYSFSSGEISPLMKGRSDTDTYSKGLTTLRNMYSDSRGPAKNRESLRFILNLASSTDARIESFERNGELVIFIFTDLEFHLVRTIDSPVITTFVAPWTAAQVNDIYITPLPDGRVFYFFHPNVEPHKFVDSLGSIVTQEFLASGNFTVPANITSLSVCVCGGGGGGGEGTSPAGLNSCGAGGGGGSGVVKNTAVVVVPGEVIPIVIGAGGLGNVASPGPGGGPGGVGENSTFTAVSATITSIGGGGGEGGNITTALGGIGGSGGGNGGSADYGSFIVGQDGAACTFICGGSSFLGGIGGQVTASNLSTGGGGGGGGFGIGGNGGEGLAATTNGTPGVLGGGGGGGRSRGSNGADGGQGKVTVTYVLLGGGSSLDPVSFIAAPVEWTNENWPSCATYHQSRLVMAGEPDQSERIIGSKTGLPEDLTIGTTDEDAFSFIMENYGNIEWLVSAKQLLLGSVNGEYVITANGGVITPSDIQILQQSSYGSASIQPVKIGDQVIYVSPDRRKVRAMNYEERQTNWMSVDLTFDSEHITKGLIRDLAWAQHPNNLLWVTLEDGTMACLSYERGTGIQGWHRHETSGKILGMSAGFDGERSTAVAVVIRNPGELDIEAMSNDFFLDSWVQDTSFTPYITPVTGKDIFYVEGADHLEGIEASITVDGAVHKNRFVGAPSEPGAADGAVGRVYIDYDGTAAVIGLQYIAEMELLDIDGGSNTGSGRAEKKRWNKVYVELFESGVPLINNRRGNDRSEDSLMDTLEPLITGPIVTTAIGWDRDARINVKQDLPLPLIVISVYGEMQKNKF